MQINKIVNAAAAVAGNTTFFANSAIPAEQIVQKIVFPIGGQVISGAGAVTRLLAPIAKLEVPPINVGGSFIVTKAVWRAVGTASVAVSAAALVSARLRRTDTGPTTIVASLVAGTDASPSVLSALTAGQVELGAATNLISSLAPTAAGFTADLQVELFGDGAETIDAQTVGGSMFIELYLIGLPLQ
jgi:hypothetical protein